MKMTAALFAREFNAKGHKPGSQPDLQIARSLIYEEEYAALESFQPSYSIPLSPAQPILFYPGSGCDILTPLFYIEKLFPTKPEFNFLFIDVEPFLPLIKTILDDVGIPFSNTSEGIVFYWRNQKITLTFLHDDVFSFLTQTDLEPFDIYFEKAFRIIKEESMAIEQYEHIVLQKLNSGGIIISDSGFKEQQLQYYKIPNELSSYSEMVLAQKK